MPASSAVSGDPPRLAQRLSSLRQYAAEADASPGQRRPFGHEGEQVPVHEPKATIDVLIAHPEPAGRAVIRGILDGHPHVRVVAARGDGDEAVAEAHRLRPAVILLDDRITTPTAIAALSRRSRVILLTGATESHVVATLLHEPARGYLIYDNFEPTDLLGAVDAVAQGLCWLSPIAASVAVAQIRGSAGCTVSASARAANDL
ncbi:hypothetical protein ACSDR0_37890 [Streptosporangium sp. G11]|uniref:hypothetical protein n=1 Tax=Streptosporangium sp. G11 TaxID=3436926 RepID=UPI003EBBE857